MLILPLPRANAAFDEDLPALREVLPDDLRLLAPHHDPMPLGGFLLLAALVGPALGGGEAEVRHGLLAGGVAQLGVGAQISDQNDLVDSHTFLRVRPSMGSPSRGPSWGQDTGWRDVEGSALIRA